MPSTTEPRISSFYGKRGNPLALVVDLAYGDAGFSWVGVNARCHVREGLSGTGSVLCEPAANVTDTGDGKAQLLVTFTKEQTAALPEESFADIELRRTSPAFGPFNSPTFRLVMETAITRD